MSPVHKMTARLTVGGIEVSVGKTFSFFHLNPTATEAEEAHFHQFVCDLEEAGIPYSVTERRSGVPVRIRV